MIGVRGTASAGSGTGRSRAPPRGVRRSQPMRLVRRRARAGRLFLLPALLVLGAFFLYPLIRTIYLSFTAGSLVGEREWIGIDNYRELWHSEEFRHSLRITVYYVGGVTLISIPLGFVLAVLLDRVRYLSNFFRAVFFLPVVVSTVVASIVFVSVVHPLGGVMQILPLPFGLDSTNWYQSKDHVIPGLILFTVWKQVGVYTVILLAGLANQPPELHEAARVDGAGSLQTLRYITIPLLKPLFLFCVAVSIIYGFQSFAIIFVATGGGPANSSQIIPLLIYDSAFRFGRMGYASAMAVTLFVIVGILTYVQFRLLSGDSEP